MQNSFLFIEVIIKNDFATATMPSLKFPLQSEGKNFTSKKHYLKLAYQLG
jgi:hypothetical protein